MKIFCHTSTTLRETCITRLNPGPFQAMTTLIWEAEAVVLLLLALCRMVHTQTWRSSSEYIVLDCPRSMSVPTDFGKSWAKVSWIAPRFIDPDGVEVLPARVSHTPGERFPVGIHTVGYSLLEGNHKILCSFIIHVDDEEPPRILNCPSDITVPADPGSKTKSAVTWAMPVAIDNFQIQHFSSSSAIGSSFPMGHTSVTYTAVDLKGNKAECTFNVIVTDDESPILEGCPVEALAYVDPTAHSGIVSWTPPLAVDNAGPPRVTCTRSRGESFPIGRTEVVYTATDATGNSATCSFNVVVKVEIPGNKIFLRNHSSTELEISWPQHVNQEASSYLIYIWPVGTDKPAASDHQYHPINWRESFTTRTLRDLSPGTAYNIRIYVTGIGDQLNRKFRTNPNQPTGFTFEPGSLDSTSVVLIWQPPVGNFDQYQISYHAASSDSIKRLRPLDKGVVRHYVNDLDPETPFIFSLVSVSGVGASKSRSAAVSLNLTTAPLPQSEILLQRVTSSTIQIVARLSPATNNTVTTPWVHHMGDYQNRLRPYRSGTATQIDEDEVDDYHHSDGYVIAIYSNKSDVFTDVIFEYGYLKYEFTSLVPTTAYTIRIIPSDASGDVLEKTTRTRPATVQNPILRDVTNTSVSISWTPPAEGRYDAYTVTFAPNSLQGMEPIAVERTEVTINELVPMTTYVVSIVTVYGILKSDLVDIEVTPGVDKPSSMLHIEAASCMTPILACCVLSAVLLCVGIYVVRLKMCYKYIPTHTRHTEENTYENPTRPNSDYITSPSYMNTEGCEAMAMLLRSHRPPVSVSGYMYPPLARAIFGRGKRTSSENKENGSSLAPIYYNVKEGDS